MPALSSTSPAAIAFTVPTLASEIPLEVWKLIIVYATYVPGGYDRSLSSPFDVSQIRVGCIAFHENLNAASSLKKSLQLVCRPFKSIIQELLYEFLFLRDNDYDGQIDFDDFRSSKVAVDLGVDKNGERRGAGWFAKRLEIFAQLEPCVGQRALDVMNKNKIDAIVTVLELCPRVEVLGLGFGARAPVNEADLDNIGLAQIQNGQVDQNHNVDSDVTHSNLISRRVFSTMFKSPTVNYFHLRSLEWTSEIVPATNLLFTYLPTLINLESFYLNIVHSYYPEESAAGITLSKLHALDIVSGESDPSSLLGLMATWNLKSFRNFRLTTSSEMSFPLTFYAAHGGKLSVHDFNFLGSEAAPELLRQCTSLCDMVTNLRWMPLHLKRLESKTVKRIGIRDVDFLRPDLLSADLAELFTCFDLILSPLVLKTDESNDPPAFETYPSPVADLDLQEIEVSAELAAYTQQNPPLPVRPYRFPLLHTVRLLEFSPLLFKERKWRSSDVVMWGLWVKRFERANVRLEDHDGELITIDVSEINMFIRGDEPCGIYKA